MQEREKRDRILEPKDAWEEYGTTGLREILAVKYLSRRTVGIYGEKLCWLMFPAPKNEGLSTYKWAAFFEMADHSS